MYKPEIIKNYIGILTAMHTQQDEIEMSKCTYTLKDRSWCSMHTYVCGNSR